VGYSLVLPFEARVRCLRPHVAVYHNLGFTARHVATALSRPWSELQTVVTQEPVLPSAFPRTACKTVVHPSVVALTLPLLFFRPIRI